MYPNGRGTRPKFPNLIAEINDVRIHKVLGDTVNGDDKDALEDGQARGKQHNCPKGEPPHH